MTQVIPHTTGADAGEVARHSDNGLIICIGRRRFGEAALAEVFRRHGGPMYTLAAQVCGTELGQDVVREVLVALWRQPGHFDANRSSLRGFLLAQVHARAFELVRTDPARGTSASAAVVRGPGVDIAAVAAHVGEGVWSVLSSLPEHDCSAIALAYFCGFSCAELGDLLGQPQRTIAGRMRSGLVGLGARTARHDSTR